jgi:hypothetical protein
MPDAQLLCASAGCSLWIIFSGFDMLRDRASQCQWASPPLLAALLHEQLSFRWDEKNVNPSVLEAALMDIGSRFLTRDQTFIIDDIEQFNGLRSFPK